MRVTVVALALLVGAGAARADSSPLEAYAPLKVVGLMPDTSQALVWDEPVAEYRLVKVGDTLEGWKVLEISARDKRVTVGQDDVRDDLALTRQEARYEGWNCRHRRGRRCDRNGDCSACSSEGAGASRPQSGTRQSRGG